MFHTNMQHVMSNNLVSCITIFLLHVKPHGVRGLSKKYHLDLDPKLDNGKFAIQRIPCEFVASTNMSGMACVPSVDCTKQPRYQPVVDCKYWPVLGYFNNYNIIHFTNKTTCSEDFDEAHQVVLYGISTNMAPLPQTGKYGAINTLDHTNLGYY